MNDTTTVDPSASGRFLLRLDAQLHAALRAEAAAEKVSLNELCARTLAAYAFDGKPDDLRAVVDHAAALYGDTLVGIVAFGSWARGEAADGSDVDVLIVLAPGKAITRDLYRRWDAAPLTLDERTVDPHLVALPERAAPVSAVWAEVARDGLILHDRDHRLARHLGAVRRVLLAGTRRRGTIHGQPYWAEVTREGSHAEP
ncbi:MAG: nucleotidyltransferase domain-containing protein [Ardenticatenales bacterium]